MNAVVPWQALVALAYPFAPKFGPLGRRPAFALETMLRIHFMQQWFGLSDPATEEALHDAPLYQAFVQPGAGMSRVASLMKAPASTKNNSGKRDPEMHQTQKGKQWYFDMKAHIGADAGYQGATNCKALDKVSAEGAIVEKIESVKARVRAKVEHPFRVIKCQFGYVKTRYRGLAKNTEQVFTLFALSSLWMVRHSLFTGVAG